MTPDERKDVRDLAKHIGKELGSKDAAKNVMHFFESTYRLQDRLREMMTEVLTMEGFVRSINDAQAACLDFMTFSQAFAATAARLSRHKRSP